MIVIAIIFHKLGHYFPLWITNDNFNDLREKFTLKRIFVELSGLIFNLLLAFLIVLSINLSTKERFLLNKDAVYGIEFSSVAKEIGFKNGDKIISIDNKDVVRFSDILRSILLSSGEIKIKIDRDGLISQISISDIDRRKLVADTKEKHFLPIGLNSAPDNNEIGLKFQEKRKGIKETIQSLTDFMKYYKLLLFPKQSEYKSIGSFMVFKITNLISLFYMFAAASFFIGLVNLLPFPGFDIGNVVIAFVEKIRNKKFDRKKLKIARILSVSIIIALLLMNMYIN